MLPGSRSMKWCREQGFIVEKVEHWNSFARIRQDLFGFADLIVLDGSQGSCLIQVTTKSNFIARRYKILKEAAVRIKAMAWLTAGNRIVIHGWAMDGPRDKRKKWNLRSESITLADFR